uniref:Uncharacterized protein n=1 Tax=Ixodes ricinus TaxID=34613 RepID=A0A6B0U4E9_IXORI
MSSGCSCVVWEVCVCLLTVSMLDCVHLLLALTPETCTPLELQPCFAEVCTALLLPMTFVVCVPETSAKTFPGEAPAAALDPDSRACLNVSIRRRLM